MRKAACVAIAARAGQEECTRLGGIGCEAALGGGGVGAGGGHEKKIFFMGRKAKLKQGDPGTDKKRQGAAGSRSRKRKKAEAKNNDGDEFEGVEMGDEFFGWDDDEEMVFTSTDRRIKTMTLSKK